MGSSSEIVSGHWAALLVLAACKSHARDSGSASIPLDVALLAQDASSVEVVERDDSRLRSATHSPSGSPATKATDWCIEGLSALDEDVCYVLPKLAPGRPRRLIVYLHGIIPPVPDSPQKRTVQTAVLRASVRAGVAAIVPRGRRGVGPAGARDWWAWPTTPRAIADLTPSIVARWEEAKAKLEGISGIPFERTYLAGSSNGAYFLAALAARGPEPFAAFPVDGFGAMSGGAASERLTRAGSRPFYVGFGEYDTESRANARSLVTALQTAHWPVRAAEHPFGHGANEVYLDEAIEFWSAADGSTPGEDR